MGLLLERKSVTSRECTIVCERPTGLSAPHVDQRPGQECPGLCPAGITILLPWVSLSAYWTGPGIYDFSRFDGYLTQLLEASPDAFFLPKAFLYSISSG